MTRMNFVLPALTLLAATATGCAVQGTPGRDMRLAIDNAALFGRTVEEFVLPDGSAASLRELDRRFSLRLGAYSRVVEIDKATAVRFRSTQEVDGFTLIVLDKSESNCRHKMHLLAVRGAEVRAWDLGDCKAPPVASISGDLANFDVSTGTRTTRYQFSGGRLLYGDLAPRMAPVSASATVGSGGRTIPVAVVPARVAPADSVVRDEPGGTPPGSGTNAAHAAVGSAAVGGKPARRVSTLPRAELDFERKEQAPRTMYLNR